MQEYTQTCYYSLRRLLGEKITQSCFYASVGACRSQTEPVKAGSFVYQGLAFFSSLYPTACPLCKWLRDYNLAVLALIFIVTLTFTLTLTCVCNMIVIVSPVNFLSISNTLFGDTFIYHYQRFLLHCSVLLKTSY